MLTNLKIEQLIFPYIRDEQIIINKSINSMSLQTTMDIIEIGKNINNE